MKTSPIKTNHFKINHLLTLFIVLIITTVQSGGGWALEPVTEPEILESIQVSLLPGQGSEAHEIQKVRIDGEIRIIVSEVKDGSQIWTSEELGEEDKLFVLNGAILSLAAEDITGDGQLEIITAAFYGPLASGLYIFSYNPETHEFMPIQCYFPEYDLSRDMLVSDAYQESGYDLVLRRENGDLTASTLGMVYPDDPDLPSQLASYLFYFENGRFVHGETKLIGGDEQG